ncbi:hypothetical protein [Sinorhizobium meliloti]|uniref:hypothetical protein n=1 Tax=Rhizobium meliloti TaxID=382 RepID=UPI0013E3DE43|nr:hypothetical protein [Sinorhizobium meliloti]
MTIEVSETRNGKTTTHRLDPSQVDQLDEISGDEQHALSGVKRTKHGNGTGSTGPN